MKVRVEAHGINELILDLRLSAKPCGIVQHLEVATSMKAHGGVAMLLLHCEGDSGVAFEREGDLVLVE